MTPRTPSPTDSRRALPGRTTPGRAVPGRVASDPVAPAERTGPRPRPGARRWAAVGLAAALVVAGCSSKESGSGGSSGTGGGGGTTAAELPPCPLDALAQATEPVEVVVWHTQQAKSLDTLQALADQYNASQSKVRIRLENQGSSYEEIVRKFESAVPTKQLPGLIMVDDTSTQAMADSGVILPAQSCVNADKVDLKDFREVATDYYTVDGVLWPASANLGNILFFYNKDHFRKAGLDPDKPPTNLDEVRQAAEKIKAADIGGVEAPLVHEVSSWKTEFWLTGAHSPVVNNDNGRSAAATEGALTGNDKALELFTWFNDMNNAGLLQPIPATEGQINQYLAMANQTASMMVESSSAATSIEAFLGGEKLDGVDTGSVDTGGLDIGAGAFPGMVPGSRTQMGGSAWYITNTTPPEVQAAAWDFMKFMNGDTAQVEMLKGGSYLPYRISADATPEAKAFYDASLSGRWLKIADDQINEIDPSFPGPLIGPYTQFRKAMGTAMDNMLFKAKSPQESIDTAQGEITKALVDYGEGGF